MQSEMRRGSLLVDSCDLNMAANEGETDPLIQKKHISLISRLYVSKPFLLNLVIKRCTAELLGTALYMFIGASSMSDFIGTNDPHLPTVALAYGFCFAGLSGAMVDIRYIIV